MADNQEPVDRDKSQNQQEGFQQENSTEQSSFNKKAGGFTVGDIEGKMKKYGLEITLCTMFILTAVFTLIWGGAMAVWSILLCMIFAIIGVLIPRSTHKISTHSLKFVYREKVTSIIVAVAGILISIFIPAIIFAIIGLIAGKTFSKDAEMEVASLEPDERNE